MQLERERTRRPTRDDLDHLPRAGSMPVIAPGATLVAFETGPGGDVALRAALASGLPDPVVVVGWWRRTDLVPVLGDGLHAGTAVPLLEAAQLGDAEERARAEEHVAHGVEVARGTGCQALGHVLGLPHAGSVEEALCALAGRQEAGCLVVAASPARRGYRRLRASSLERTLATSPCPVLVVPFDRKESS